MNQELKGRTALITGSTSGIGLAIAQHLSHLGVNVALNGLGDAVEIETLRQKIEQDNKTKVIYNGANLLAPLAIEELIKDTETRLGPIDILVNNAGTQFVSPVEDFPTDKWNLIIGLNLSAAFHTTRLCFRAMKARQWGRIINIASAHAHVASPYKSAYVAAKHGLLGLTKTIALEGAQFGLTCNCVCPGYVLTPLVEAQIPATMQARGLSREAVIRDVLLAAQPTKQSVTVEDVAHAVAYLSSEAARSVNGTSLSLDGGWVAQ